MSKPKKEVIAVLTPPKPRNPLALTARQLKAGSHRKSNRSVRQQEQQVLRKKLSDPDES